MNFNKLFLLLILTLFVLSACGTGLTDEEIHTKLIEANTALKTYTADMTMDMKMSGEFQGQQTTVDMQLISKGNVDRENKALEATSTIKVDAPGMKTEFETKSYIADNYIYTQLFINNWVKSELQEDIWAQQDQLSSAVELWNSGTRERLEDADNAYVFKVTPTKEELAKIFQSQQTGDINLFAGAGNLADTIKSFSVTMWVNKDSFIIERSKMDFQTVVKQPSFSPTGEVTEQEVASDISIDVKLSNIGKPVTIVLPEAAKNAVDQSKMFGGINYEDQPPAPEVDYINPE